MGHYRATVALVLAGFLYGCNDGGGADSGASSSAANSVANVSTTTPPPAGTGTGVYAREPIVASCDAGTLTAPEKQAVLAELNAVRALHRLPAVTYDPSADIYEQKSALIGVANRQLTHTPPTSLYCFTQEGAQGSAQSNLFLAGGYSPASTDSIAQFLIDDAVDSLGHRRWVLHPFLSQTSFGRVDGLPLTGGAVRYSAMSLRVIGYPDANLSATDVAYIAYPEGNYPARYFKHGWFMSFSVLAAKTGTWANDGATVDFSSAAIQVSGSGGAPLQVTDRSHNNQGFGLPNIVQWKVVGTQDNVSYAVRIAGVKVNGAVREYQYGFRIQ
ncbi:MAG: hypothetical protein ACKVQU_07245 [Burkholderiales bacterium]